MLELEIHKRDNVGKRQSKTLRDNDMIPAVCYGRKFKSTPISIKYKEFEDVFEKAGETSVIACKNFLDKKNVLIHDIQYHPVSQKIIHTDLYVVESDEKTTVEVPFLLDGVSPAQKNLNGVLIQVLHSVEVSALPKDIPSEIKIDLSSLEEIPSHITIGDLKLPDGVTIKRDEKDIIVSVALAKEEEEQEVEKVDIDSIEIQKKGKEEVKEGDGEQESTGDKKDK